MTTITAPAEQRIVDEVPKQLYIGGEWRDGAKVTLSVEDPSTREAPLCEVADASTDDAKAALTAAVEAGPEWSVHPPRERGEILRRAFEGLIARADDLALLMTLEMGKPLAESKAEIAYAAEFFRWFSEESVRIDGRYAVNSNGQGRVLTMKQPVGPCLLMTPGTSRWRWAPARSGRPSPPGCTMVLKPAQLTPLAVPAARPSCSSEAGLPDGVLNVVTSTSAGKTVGPLMSDPRLRKAVVHRLDRGLAAEAGRSSPPRTCCGSRWSSAVTRRSSCSTTPTSTRPSRARSSRRCATTASPASRPTGSTSQPRSPTTSPARLADRMGAMKVGHGADEGDPGRTADRRGPARQGRRSSSRTRPTGARRRWSAARASTAAGYFFAPTVLRGGRTGCPHPAPRRCSARWRRSRRSRPTTRRSRRRTHRVRPGRLCVHPGPQARAPRRRAPGDRHGGAQPRDGVQRRRTVRRDQAIRFRPRGRLLGMEEYLETEYVAVNL